MKDVINALLNRILPKEQDIKVGEDDIEKALISMLEKIRESTVKTDDVIYHVI